MSDIGTKISNFFNKILDPCGLIKAREKEEQKEKSIIMIGEKDNKELMKVKEFIEDHYFGKKIVHLTKEKTWYNNELIVIITKDFSKYKYSKFNLIISYSNLKEENKKIINTFGKTYYLFYRICSKSELLEETNIISSENLLLSAHFRSKINDFLDWRNNDNELSQSSLSIDSENDTLKYKD